MKNIIATIAFNLISFFMYSQISIGTLVPHPSAQLEVFSTTKGFLLPRMSAVQRNTITNPTEGLIIYCTDCRADGETQIYNGVAWVNLVGSTPAISIWPSNYVHCSPNSTTAVKDVTNPSTGKTWMDRNLGADRAALSSTDSQSYGSIFQWGRGADGHQCVNRYTNDGVTTSSTTPTLSNSDFPGHANYIIDNSDWRSPQNNNLWQGVNGINNPCPIGYRLPTEAEWISEMQTWDINNSVGAFNSVLKLTLAGLRWNCDCPVAQVNNTGRYWTSSISSVNARNFAFNNSGAFTNNITRANGGSIRCIKN